MGLITKALTKPNKDFSSVLFPKRLNFVGGTLAIGGVTALASGNEMLKAHNARKLGRVSYADGMNKMTKSFTTGVVPAMMESSGGNYQAFADMSHEIVKGPTIVDNIVDDYGATPQMISALYGMGGR